MTTFLSQPDHLIVCLLFEWLVAKEIAKMDSALCNSKLRSIFLNTLVHDKLAIIGIPSEFNNHADFNSWIGLRSIRLKAVHFSGFERKFITSMIRSLHLDLVESLHCHDIEAVEISFAVSRCKLLKSLYISSCLNMQPIQLILLLQHLPKSVHVLAFHRVARLNKEHINAITINCSQLNILQISSGPHCPSNGTTIDDLLKSLTKMTHIELPFNCAVKPDTIHTTLHSSVRCSLLVDAKLSVSGLSPRLVLDTLRKCTSLRSLSLTEAHIPHSQVESTSQLFAVAQCDSFAELQWLDQLTAQQVFLHFSAFQTVSELGVNRIEVTLVLRRSSVVDDEFIALLGMHCAGLTKLCFMSSFVTDLSMSWLLENCRQLHILSVCALVTNALLDAVVAHGEALRQLTLKRNQYVTRNCLRRAVECNPLLIIVLDYCSLSAEKISHKQVKILRGGKLHDTHDQSKEQSEWSEWFRRCFVTVVWFAIAFVLMCGCYVLDWISLSFSVQ